MSLHLIGVNLVKMKNGVIIPEKKKQENDMPSKKQTSIPLYIRTLRCTVYILIKAINVAYVPVFIYRVFQKPKKCSPVTNPLLKISATELVKKIRKKEISCEEVVQAYITRIKEVNPLLNAVIEDRFADALEDARKVDLLVCSNEFLSNGEKIIQEYPLLGVPLTVKGSLAVKGMKFTSGTVTRKECKAEFDADAVALARKAGAIPLVVTNVPELCMSWETTNKLHGTTQNPHDSTRTCGGSSGGEGSLLGAGASLIGIGSDIAGSLRLPAHFCGVWGHKPTPGAVSFDGHYPSCLQRDKWEAVFTVGPMARYASDLKTLLNVITIPENKQKLDLEKKLDIKKIKVFYSEHQDFYWQKPNRSCSGAVRKVVDHFRNICDTDPKEVDLRLKENFPDLGALDILGINDIDDIFDGNSNGAWAEFFRYITFSSKYTFMPIACGLLRKIASSISEENKSKIKELLEEYKNSYQEMLKDHGVIIVPSFPLEAPKHGDVLRTALFNGYLSLFNWLGFPVTNCPVGITKDGLPVGVQVVSLPYGDKYTLAIAEEIERAFGGWVEPS
ncbi:fatty-acid amide hydrolase 2-B-like isoform X2 [Anthonomus grandis grandis]|uniref:fatty-acid amide hydrolase 2-B-like isoform X2 n=1 Tax=Anthonomus grandis grandis TaxID=2921223 RepID=UPI0021669BB9|nr:fatty-acid amide hydrolase 2-B-like isoform X2 [Anthonomus grandis grandis]